MPSPPTNPPKSLSDAARSFAVEQAIATGIAVVDGSGQQTHVNDAFCRMVGCAREELVGARPPFSYWPEESVGEIEAALQLALAGRFPREGLTLTFRRRSGERFPVLLLLTPFIGEGASGCWQATVVDLAVAAAQLKALERSEQLLRTAQEAAHVGVWAFDLATGETWRSPECERLSGLVPGSHPSHEQWLQRVHPDDRHLLDFQHAVPPRAGESFEVEFRIRLDTGEERWLLSRGQMYCDAGGQPARFVGTNLDITERKRTAAELDQYRRELDRRVAESTGLLAERSAQLVRTHFAMDRAGIGIAWNDVSGRFLYVNDEACRQLGYSRDELLQLTVSDVNPQMTPDDFRELAAQMREHGRRFNDQAVHRRKDGSTYPVEVTAYLERADGREQFIAFYNDLTERVRLEQELRASEQRWKFALEATAQGVWDRDIPADKIDYTPRYAEMLGCAVSELGQSIAEVYARIHPDDLAGMKAAEEAHLRADTPFFFVEFRMRHKDGHYIWVESRGMVVERTPDGEPRRIIGTHTDITRRKALDASLQAAKVAAEEASASKSAFLANMSHEIRTPLNGIIGMAHLLRLSGLSDEQSERLGRLEHSAAHLLEVLNAVLDLSKIEAGKVVLEERPLRLETVVANVSSMVEESAKRKDLRLNTDVDVFPRNLLGDATRLKQSLLNYAGNAVKFTEHGSITLRAKLLREDDDCVQVRFEVADTGPGIEPAVLSRLFSSFEQGDRATTRTSGGTGLGLAITRRLAELMGGEAGAESNPGQGSRFWFTARCRKAATPVEPKAKAAVPDAKAALRLGHAGARVLLAEDNEINREVAVAILELAGLVVDCAEDGEQAVAKVGDGGYALVLMDMQMPRMDGLEATRKIRKRWPSASLPIIAMTANAFTEDRVRCQEAGMDDFLSKPVDPNQLYALLLNWLDKSRAADRP